MTKEFNFLDNPADLADLVRLDAHIDENVIGRPIHSLNKLTEITGWSLQDLKDIVLWSAMPQAEPNELAYTMLDSAAFIQLHQAALREDLTKEEIGTVIRGLSVALEKLATSEVESLVHRLTKRGYSDTGARLKAAEYGPKVTDSSMRLIEVLWRRHLAAALRRLTTGAILMRGVSDDDRQFPLIAAVGFARIVDFSQVTSKFDVSGYVDFVQNFNNRTSDIINAAGGRIIKLMGDMVVWVTSQTDTSAEIALKLAALTKAGFPAQVRAGVTWCRLVAIHGDVFGPGVNLAARLSEAPAPGQVYLDAAAADQLRKNSKFTLTPSGTLDVPGLTTAATYLLQPKSADVVRG